MSEFKVRSISSNANCGDHPKFSNLDVNVKRWKVFISSFISSWMTILDEV